VQEPIGEALIGDFNLLKMKNDTQKQLNQTRSSGRTIYKINSMTTTVIKGKFTNKNKTNYN